MSALVGVLLVLLALASTAGAGLELDLARLRGGGGWGRAVLGGLLANLVVVPAGTLLMLRAAALPHDAVTALWLVALAPGGASAPLLARLSGGEPTRVGAVYVALSVSSLGALPLLLPRLTEASIPGAQVLLLCVGLQLLPLLIGVGVRRHHPAAALRHAARLRRFGSVLLGVIVVLLLVTRGAFLGSLGGPILLAMLATVALSLVAGAVLAPRPRIPDALLACVRNLTLALLIAEGSQPGGRATLIIAAYGLVMYVAAAACVRLFATRAPPLQETS